MTEQEIKQMLQMTDQQMREAVVGLIISTKELGKRIEETRVAQAESHKAMAEAHKEMEREQKKTEKIVQQTNKQLGELGNNLGSYTAGMALPSLGRVLKTQFGLEVVQPEAISQVGSETMEIDVLAYSYDEQAPVFIVEVKSHLTSAGIKQLLKIIDKFPKFFPLLAGRTIYGVLAAVQMPDNVRNEALQKGLYLALISDDTFRLQVPPDFKPKAFGPMSKNGTQASNGAAPSNRAKK